MTTTETGQVTGTKDKLYNIIWFTESCTGPVDSGPPKKQVPASDPFGFAVSHCA